MRLRNYLLVGCVIVMAASVLKAGPTLEIDEDSWIKPSFLGQFHYSYDENAADKEDFYLRRARIIIQGQVQDGIQFFVETDNDNAGKNGVSGVSTDIQDAIMDFRVYKSETSECWVQGGLILLPFSLETKASAAKLLGIDYNAEAVKMVNSFVWRDYGVEAHGHIRERVAYHIGAFDGYDKYSTPAVEKNDGAELRLCGHVALNLVGKEEKGGLFYNQDRFSSENNFLIVGAGYDSQDKATRTVTTNVEDVVIEDAEAVAVDFQSGYRANEDVMVLLNGAYYDWDNSVFKGNTAFIETGVMVDKVMATGKYSLTDQDDSDEVADYTAGVHYFIKGHNARVGLEYRWGDSDDKVLAGLQVLL